MCVVPKVWRQLRQSVLGISAMCLPKPLHCLLRPNYSELEPQIVFIVSGEELCRPGLLPEISLFFIRLTRTLFLSVSLYV